jgi:hypothetical protein
VFFVSKLDAHRLDVLAGGLLVLLDHVIDRIWPDWHGDGLGAFGTIAAAVTRLPAPTMLAPAAMVRKPRRVGSRAGTSRGGRLQTCLCVA